MTIREYAKEHNHKIVGKLIRKVEWERNKGEKWYVDEVGNEYMSSYGNVVIITADGGVI